MSLLPRFSLIACQDLDLASTCSILGLPITGTCGLGPFPNF